MMLNRAIVVQTLVVSGLLAACALGQDKPNVDPALVGLLDRLEAAGAKIKDLRSDVRFESLNTVLEECVVRTGMLLYKEQEPNAMFLVRFDRVDQDGVINESQEWHLFDGRWYTEARAVTKQVIRREILR